MKKIIKKYKEYLISPILASVILLLVFAIKGIFPFGNITIANGDMGQGYMPFYYFLYDIVFNGKNIFYDYVLGMGSNMYGGFMADGLLNPTTFIIFLGGRENIPYMFSLVLILKISFIALTSYILFNKLNKECKFYNILFSILYAFSGYVLMYNTNIMWLDIVGLFPLFILATKYMFEKNKPYWFSIVLSLMLICNYNLAFMVLMFIIFIVPIYIRFGIEKENRKKAVYNLIIGTLLTVGLSAFSFIPSFMQVMSSYRMAGTVSNSVTNSNILFKIVVFIFYSIPIYGYAKWWKYKDQDKKCFFIIGLSLIFSAIIPIFFERVNLLWHAGSYQMFPFRYGFIPLLILYIGSLRYYSKFYEPEKFDKKKWNIINGLCYIAIFIAIVLGVATAIGINRTMPAFFLPTELFISVVMIFGFIYFAIYNIYYMENQKKKKILIVLLTIFQIIIYSYAYIGVDPQYRYGTEWSDEQIFLSNEIAKEVKDDNSLYRIKDLTASTTENCSLVYNIPSMSTFLHIISKEQVLNCEQLGYSHNKTKINDFGGTIFSDAVYGIKYVLSKENLSEEIYNYISCFDNEIKLYEYKKTLPYGINYKTEVTDIPSELKEFEAQNYLYKNMFNKQDNIIDNVEELNIEKLEDGKYKILINTEKDKELYIYSFTEIKNIEVNGNQINVPILNDKDNKKYPTVYCNGILDLGYLKKGTIEIKFDSEKELENNQIKIGLLDIEKYNKLFEETKQTADIQISGNKIKIIAKVENDTNLFIPINFDKGWKIKSTNNDNTEIKRIYNTFIGINLKSGENNIELEFKPYLYEICLKISITTILLMILAYIIEKKFNIRNVKWIMFAFWLIGIIIYCGAFIKVYIMSIIQTIFDII